MNRLVLAILPLTVASLIAPSAAQGIPRGSYMQSCEAIRVEHGELFAKCMHWGPRGIGHRSYKETHLRLPCHGDIANRDGNLVCEHGGGSPQRSGR